MAPILEVRNLTHTYSAGTPFEHKAIDNMNFSVERGEFIGIIGHTGSGKSTLMQHLNGLLKPTSGEVLLDGKDIWSDKTLTRQARFRVGLVFQYPEYQLFEETEQKEYVPEFIEAKGEVSGTTRGNAYHRVMELMDFTKVPAMDAIWQDMECMVEAKVLDTLYITLIRKDKLEAFLQSDLAKRMKKAQEEKKLYREQPFVYGLEASRLDERFPKEEKVLIQGIVDAYFEEDGQLVIVDYKTDAIRDSKELITRYKEQLKYYKEALEKLTAKKVKEMILYSYALNESVYVEV